MVIETLEAAIRIEQQSTEDSSAAEEWKKQKEYQRKHPVLAAEDSDLFDLNHEWRKEELAKSTNYNKGDKITLEKPRSGKYFT